MTALSNPFRRGFWGWCTLVHQNHAAGGENGSNMVGMCLSLSLASQKPSEQKFFVPAGTYLGVKLLHPHSPTEASLLTSRRHPATNALCVEKHRRASEGRLFLHCIFLSSTTSSYSLWFIVVLQRQAPRRRWYALPIFPADTPRNSLPSAAVTIVVISSPIKWSKVMMLLRRMLHGASSGSRSSGASSTPCESSKRTQPAQAQAGSGPPQLPILASQWHMQVLPLCHCEASTACVTYDCQALNAKGVDFG